MRTLIFCLMAIPVLGFAQSGAKKGSARELAEWMTGTFDSGAQAKADTNFFAVNLRIIPIWNGRKDGYWLYVEQALSTRLNAPYRQRVYQVTRKKGEFRSAVFELKDPASFVGATAQSFDQLQPGDLLPRTGCTVVLRKENNQYVGGTEGSGCESTLRGASYATSEVVVTSTSLTSWDRGFDADGNQKWGSTLGAYVFVKKQP